MHFQKFCYLRLVWFLLHEQQPYLERLICRWLTLCYRTFQTTHFYMFHWTKQRHRVRAVCDTTQGFQAGQYNGVFLGAVDHCRSWCVVFSFAHSVNRSVHTSEFSGKVGNICDQKKLTCQFTKATGSPVTFSSKQNTVSNSITTLL